MKHTITAAIATGTLLLSGAAFTPRSAEAHCGDHQNNCGHLDWGTGTHCNGAHLIGSYDRYLGYCNGPQAGQPGGPFGPCGDCDPNGHHDGCFDFSYDQDFGVQAPCSTECYNNRANTYNNCHSWAGGVYNNCLNDCSNCDYLGQCDYSTCSNQCYSDYNYNYHDVCDAEFNSQCQ